MILLDTPDFGPPPVGTGIVVRLTQVLEGQRNLPHLFHPVVTPAAS